MIGWIRIVERCAIRFDRPAPFMEEPFDQVLRRLIGDNLMFRRCSGILVCLNRDIPLEIPCTDVMATESTMEGLRS